MFDLSVIGIIRFIIYPVILISISIYMSFSKEMTMNRFFFASRNTNWFVLGMSLLTTSLISPYILGFSGTGSFSVIPILYGIISTILISILGWLLAPLFLKMNLSTLPEYFERRFNLKCRLFISAIFIISNVFIRFLIVLVIGNYLLRTITGIDAYLSIFFFLFVTSIYLIIGGLHAEIYVSLIQVIIIGVVILFFSYWILSNGSQFSFRFDNISFTSGFNSSTHNYTPWEVLLGLPVIGFGFWCIDQSTVQKVLSIKYSSSMKKTSLVSGLMQIIPILFFILSGIVIEKISRSSTEISFNALMVSDFMPSILKVGIMLAIMAALMASFANIFNSTTILITLDFYHSFKKKATDRQLVLIGRLTMIGVLLLSVLLIPLSEKLSTDIIEKLFGIFCFFIAMITAVFLVGLLNKKTQARSAFITLSVSSVLIVLRAIFDLFFSTLSSGYFLFDLFLKSNLLAFSIFIFFLSVLLLFVTVQKTVPQFILKQFQKKKVVPLNKYEWDSNKKIMMVFPLVITITLWLKEYFLGQLK